jgi:hypothetical protein
VATISWRSATWTNTEWTNWRICLSGTRKFRDFRKLLDEMDRQLDAVIGCGVRSQSCGMQSGVGGDASDFTVPRR